MKDKIKVGDRAEVEIRRKDLAGKIFVSLVENVRKDGTVMLHVPISYGKLVDLPKGVKYNFVFFTEAGLIRFVGVIEDYITEDGFPLMKVDLVNDGEKIQRRDHYRFDCVLPMKFAVMEQEEFIKIQRERMAEIEQDEQDRRDPPTKQERQDRQDKQNRIAKNDFADNKQAGVESHPAIVKNISGGGIRFSTNADIEEGDVIRCVIKIQDDFIIVIGKVLQKYHFPKSNYRFQYRGFFSSILPSEQEKIIQYIFNEQKRILQKIKH